MPEADMTKLPFEDVLKLASAGSRDAQAALSNAALDAISSGLLTRDDQIEALAAAEIWSRLAAAHGRTGDLLHLAGVLFCRSALLSTVGLDERMPADDFQAEAVALVAEAAERGDEDGATYLNLASDAVAPEVIERSRLFRVPGQGEA
jgi:hypothetical protein